MFAPVPDAPPLPPCDMCSSRHGDKWKLVWHLSKACPWKPVRLPCAPKEVAA